MKLLKRRFAILIVLGLSAAFTPAFSAPVAAPTEPVQSPLLTPEDRSGFILSGDEVYAFREAYPLMPGLIPLAHSTLSVPVNHIHHNDYFYVDISLSSDGDNSGNEFYNLYWNRGIPLPGRIALFDSQKRYVQDLLDSMGGMNAGIGSGVNYMTNIPQGGYVGMIMPISLQYLRVPAGTYYLQVIYFSRFVQRPYEGRPFDLSKAELFRSNAVQITVLDSGSAKP